MSSAFWTTTDLAVLRRLYPQGGVRAVVDALSMPRTYKAIGSMASELGLKQDKHGVRTLDDIRARCDVDDETGCWKWKLACSSSARAGSRLPVAWSAEQGRIVSVLRLAYELGGKTLHPKWTVWRTCECDLCVNPDHLMGGTKRMWGSWKVRTSRPESLNQVALRIVSRRARSDKKLTEKDAAYIRASDKTGKELAEQFGVSSTSISRVRMMRTWVPQVPGSSVFNWRGVLSVNDDKDIAA